MFGLVFFSTTPKDWLKTTLGQLLSARFNARLSCIVKLLLLSRCFFQTKILMNDDILYRDDTQTLTCYCDPGLGVGPNGRGVGNMQAGDHSVKCIPISNVTYDLPCYDLVCINVLA